VLVTYALGTQFAESHAEWTPARAALAGFVGSALFFGSILLHELGHSLVSISLGLRVRSITLFLFGGLAQLSGEPRRPRDMALIALAGPLVSLLLFLGFLVVALALGDTGPWGETGQAVAFQVAGVNALLLCFNLVPGLPLDGGHVLRAFLWAATGSEERGTRAASAAGSAFALVFIGLGVLVAARGELLAGLWMVLIGWFVLRAARATSMQVFVRKYLSRIRLGDALRERSTASRWSSVADVQELVARVRRPVFIVDGEELLGWVTPEQVRTIAPAKRAFTPVSSVLVPVARMIGLGADRTLLDALSLMNESGARELAVFEEDRPIGAMTRDELLIILRDGYERRARGAPRTAS
jgi:Zn-dependent protease/CBS domain-containing protein